MAMVYSCGRHVCTKYHGLQATMLVIVINCLRLFCCCFHGDGSDGDICVHGNNKL